jgi:hypothetical protein
MSISAERRRYVRERAGDCCEYCRVADDGRLSRLHVDHIIALKHGGTDEDNNLCLACYKCNSYKGSNVAALDPITGDATKLYHPRQQNWDEHFEINPDATLVGLTPEGRATLEVLRINDKSRVRTRRLAQMAGDYPCQPD